MFEWVVDFVWFCVSVKTHSAACDSDLIVIHALICPRVSLMLSQQSVVKLEELNTGLS